MCSTLDAFNLKQHITEPTHIKSNTVDLIFAPDDCYFRVKVTYYHISTHFLVTTSMPLQHTITSSANYSIYRVFNNIFNVNFCRDLTATEMFLSSSNHINIFASQIKTSITSTLDIHAPLWSSRKRPTVECWQKKHIDDLKYKRRHFENKFRSTKHSSYKRKHKLLCKTTNAATIAKHKNILLQKFVFKVFQYHRSLLTGCYLDLSYR